MAEQFDIASFFPLYPSQDDPNIQKILGSKAEFQEVASQRKESLKKGGYFKHQKAFEYFMRIYNVCLLYGETGVGKTGSFAKVARYFQARPELGFKRAIFITNNDILKDEFKRQLLTQYGPEGGVPEESLRRKKGSWFTITTYRAFAGHLKSRFFVDGTWRYEALLEEYDHSIIFVDEVHKIRKEDSEEDSKENSGSRLVNIVETRRIFQEVFHRLKYSKIILSSGTPMINDPKEIIEIMNLILPLSKQIPKTLNLDKASIQDLQPYFNGRVCYVRALDTGIKKVVEGEVIEGVKVYRVKMSQFQYDVYSKFNRGKEEKEEDEGEDEEKPAYDVEKADSFISKSRQAATFVFPNGQLAQFGVYFDKVTVGQATRGRAKKDRVSSFTKYEFADPFFEYFVEELKLDPKSFSPLSVADKMQFLSSKVSTKDKLRAVGKLSAIFAEAIRLELENPGCAFANDIHTKASGVLVFSKLLEIFGFKPFEEMLPTVPKDGKGAFRPSFNKQLRYAVLTSETHRNLKNFMLESWNHPDNYNGEYIKIFITSPTGDTGINLSHVQRIYSFPSPWNLSSQHQTDTRAIRSTSHNVLLERLKVKEVNVRFFYFYASGPKGQPTVGLKMYQDAAVKDKKIKRIEGFLKRLAYNGIFDQARNEVSDLINSPSKEEKVDYSNYDTLYADDLVSKCNLELEALFRVRGYYHFHELRSALKQYRLAILLRSLRQYVGTQRTILNSYNFPCLLRVSNGIYVLSQDFLSPPDSARGLGFYNSLSLTQKVSIDPYAVTSEEVKRISSDFFYLTEEKKIHSYIDSLVKDPPKLIVLLEEGLTLKSEGRDIKGEGQKAASVLLKRFQFAWYRCQDLSSEVKVLKKPSSSKPSSKVPKVKGELSAKELKANENGPIFLHIMKAFFSSKTKAGYIPSILNPDLNSTKYLDPKDKKWKEFDVVSDLLPYNSFIQKYQKSFLKKYDPVYCIISRENNRHDIRIVDKCKREVNDKKDRSEEDSRITSTGRVLYSYLTEDIVDAIYNSGSKPLLDKYRAKGEALAKGGSGFNEASLDKVLLAYVTKTDKKVKFKYNPDNTYSLDRKAFRLGFYSVHDPARKELIEKILLDSLLETGHVLDLGLTTSRFNTDPEPLGREHCQ